MQPLPLNRFLYDNRYFFGPFLLFLLTGAGLLLTMETGDLVFFFSDRRTGWLNGFFRFVTRLGEELPFILAIAGLLLVRYRFALAIPLLGFTVGLVSYLMKTYFDHPRPYAFIEGLNQLERLCVVDGVPVHTGNTSFPSGHTMAAFALYAFLAFLFPRRPWVGLLSFLIALLVGLSRVYLVQHFLKDVYLGAVVGVALAVVVYFLQSRWRGGRLDRALFNA